MQFYHLQQMDGPRGYYAKYNVRQRKINIIWFHLYVESKEQNKWTNKKEADLRIQRTNWWLPGGRGIGGMGETSKGIKKYRVVVTK